MRQNLTDSRFHKNRSATRTEMWGTDLEKGLGLVIPHPHPYLHRVCGVWFFAVRGWTLAPVRNQLWEQLREPTVGRNYTDPRPLCALLIANHGSRLSKEGQRVSGRQSLHWASAARRSGLCARRTKALFLEGKETSGQTLSSLLWGLKPRQRWGMSLCKSRWPEGS